MNCFNYISSLYDQYINKRDVKCIFYIYCRCYLCIDSILNRVYQNTAIYTIYMFHCSPSLQAYTTFPYFNVRKVAILVKTDCFKQPFYHILCWHFAASRYFCKSGQAYLITCHSDDFNCPKTVKVTHPIMSVDLRAGYYLLPPPHYCSTFCFQNFSTIPNCSTTHCR